MELHDVLRQRPGFIAEDILNHAQFLVQARALHLGGQVTLLVVDHDILRDKVGLNEVYCLKGDKERDRDKVHESNEPDSDVKEALTHHVGRAAVASRIQIPGLISVILRPECQDDGAKNAAAELNSHCNQNELVDEEGILRALCRSIGAILHNFGVVARKDTKSEDPLSVPEAGALKKDLIGVDGNFAAIL